jgi:uncharacterized protein (DUF2267 family)
MEPEPNGLLEIARDIEQHAPLHAPSTGSDALSAVLYAVAEKLDPADVEELADLLPPDLRPVLEACSLRDEEFGTGEANAVDRIARELSMDARDAEWTGSVVLEALFQRVPQAAAERLAGMLPSELTHPKPHGPG